MMVARVPAKAEHGRHPEIQHQNAYEVDPGLVTTGGMHQRRRRADEASRNGHEGNTILSPEGKDRTPHEMQMAPQRQVMSVLK